MPEGTNESNSTTTTTTNQAAKPSYTEEQQRHIQELIDGRFAKVAEKHNSELSARDAKIAELEAALQQVKEGATKTGKENEGSGSSSAEKAQLEQLLRAAQAETAAAKEAFQRAEERAKGLDAENFSIRKDQVLRDAAAELAAADGIEFHDMNLVQTLVGKSIERDPDSGTWVVKENGIVKKNASLEPMSLSEFLKGFAAQRPFLVKSKVVGGAGSSESQRGVTNGVSTVRSKSDLKTAAEKSDWIGKFGLSAWESLPLK